MKKDEKSNEPSLIEKHALNRLNEVEQDFNENIPKIKDKLISSYSKCQNLISNIISNYHSKSSALR